MGPSVHTLAHQAVRYLNDLGLPATGPNKHRGKALPYYMTDAFELAELDLVDHPVVLAIDKQAYRSPAEAEQLIRKLGEVIGSPAVYVTDTLTSYERKRLIERRVPFLVPGNQLYLPGLGMDLREHFRRSTDRQKLSPSAQAVLLAILQHPAWTIELTASEIASKLDYTPMTASRAARELAAAGLVELTKAPGGQTITLTGAPKDTWELALPLLRSPVQRVVYAKLFAFLPPPAGVNDVVSAGTSALARHSMLATESTAVFACSRDTWQVLKKWVQVLPHPDGNTDELQIWSYPPTLKKDPSNSMTVAEADPLSLYLSLRDMDDPRVQSALDELLDKTWR